MISTLQVNPTPAEPQKILVGLICCYSLLLFNSGYNFQGYLVTLSYLIPPLIRLMLAQLVNPTSREESFSMLASCATI
jgi:purine-cytosine permease-like protein